MAILGVGRDGVYQGVKTGEIPAIRCGKHIRICRQALMAKLQGEPAPIDVETVTRAWKRLLLEERLSELDAQRAEVARQLEAMEPIRERRQAAG